MADKLNEMKDLMDGTRKLLKVIVNKHEENQVKTLDYGFKLKERLLKIKEINSNDEYFDDNEVGDEFIESLETFIEVFKKHRENEESPFFNLMHKELVLEVLADLDRRYNQLAE